MTAPVERRVLSATIVTRADVTPAGAVAVSGPPLDAQGDAGSGIVTGVFVERGDEVAAGSRLVEVAGRPVFVFAGATPAFRTMRPGMSGRDVSQLQAGLIATGCDPGDSGVYDAATKQCVEQLYDDAGYLTTRSSPSELSDLAAATAAVADAQDALAMAELALWTASQPPDHSAVLAANSAINDAQRSLDAATAARQDTGPAREALGIAQASHAELTDDPNVAAEQLAVEQQQRSVERTQQALSDLETEAGPIVPLGEIVFVADLPVRVDAVQAVVGQVSGTEVANDGLVVLATSRLEANLAISQADRELVQAGTEVDLLYEATGDTFEGVVRSIGDEPTADDSSSTPSYPAVVDADFPDTWSGLNVRATFTSATTTNEVLVVPLAAVSSAADGQTRVQVEQTGGAFATVPVHVGLSADGFAEITPDDTDLIDAGDQVLIGR